MNPDSPIFIRWCSNVYYRLYLSLLFSSFSNVCLLFSIVFICLPPFHFKNKLKKPLLITFRNFGNALTLLIDAMDRIKPIYLIFQHSFKICNKTIYWLWPIRLDERTEGAFLFVLLVTRISKYSFYMNVIHDENLSLYVEKPNFMPQLS